MTDDNRRRAIAAEEAARAVNTLAQMGAFSGDTTHAEEIASVIAMAILRGETRMNGRCTQINDACAGRLYCPRTPHCEAPAPPAQTTLPEILTIGPSGRKLAPDYPPRSDK